MYNVKKFMVALLVVLATTQPIISHAHWGTQVFNRFGFLKRHWGKVALATTAVLGTIAAFTRSKTYAEFIPQISGHENPNLKRYRLTAIALTEGAAIIGLERIRKEMYKKTVCEWGNPANHGGSYWDAPASETHQVSWPLCSLSSIAEYYRS